jgi:hypothetical protein
MEQAVMQTARAALNAKFILMTILR